MTRLPIREVEAHQVFIPSLFISEETPPQKWTRTVCNKHIQLVITWSLKWYGDKQWQKFLSNWKKSWELRLTAYMGRLVKLVRWREGMFFKVILEKSFLQYKIELSQNCLIRPLGFTLTPDGMKGTRRSW